MSAFLCSCVFLRACSLVFAAAFTVFRWCWRDSSAVKGGQHHEGRTFCPVEFLAGMYSAVDQRPARKITDDLMIRNLKSPLWTRRPSRRHRVHPGGLPIYNLGHGDNFVTHAVGPAVCRTPRLSPRPTLFPRPSQVLRQRRPWSGVKKM